MTECKQLAVCAAAQGPHPDRVEEARCLLKLLDNLMTTRTNELHLNRQELDGLALLFHSIEDRLTSQP